MLLPVYLFCVELVVDTVCVNLLMCVAAQPSLYAILHAVMLELCARVMDGWIDGLAVLCIFCFLQALRVVKQLGALPENSQNLAISGAITSALVIISNTIDGGPPEQFRCRDAVLTCVSFLKNIASAGPVRAGSLRVYERAYEHVHECLYERVYVILPLLLSATLTPLF